jgi:hypothetical protein
MVLAHYPLTHLSRKNQARQLSCLCDFLAKALKEVTLSFPYHHIDAHYHDL